MFRQLRGGGGTNSGDAHAADVAQVFEHFEEKLKESGDAIGAGKNNPVVRIQFQQSVRDIMPFGWRGNSDGGNFKDIRAQCVEHLGAKDASGRTPCKG